MNEDWWSAAGKGMGQGLPKAGESVMMRGAGATRGCVAASETERQQSGKSGVGAGQWRRAQGRRAVIRGGDDGGGAIVEDLICGIVSLVYGENVT